MLSAPPFPLSLLVVDFHTESQDLASKEQSFSNGTLITYFQEQMFVILLLGELTSDCFVPGKETGDILLRYQSKLAFLVFGCVF